MNYRQQLEVIKGLSIPPDTQTRMDCPFCNGRNTLSIDTTENKLSEAKKYYELNCNEKNLMNNYRNVLNKYLNLKSIWKS